MRGLTGDQSQAPYFRNVESSHWTTREVLTLQSLNCVSHSSCIPTLDSIITHHYNHFLASVLSSLIFSLFIVFNWQNSNSGDMQDLYKGKTILETNFYVSVFPSNLFSLLLINRSDLIFSINPFQFIKFYISSKCSVNTMIY